MKRTRFRLAAVLTALMLFLGVLPAMAELPVFGGIKMPDTNMQVDIQMTVNPALGSLISGFSGSAPDEATQALITTITNAANKLKTRIVSGKTGVSGAVGTELGDLFDFQAKFDKDSLENGLTASFLPGLVLGVDPAAVKAAFAQAAAPAIDPALMMEAAQPYLSVVKESFAEVQAAAKSEEGSYEFEGYGSFTKRSGFSLTTHMLAGLLGRLGETLQQDNRMQELLTQVASNTRPEGSEAPKIEELLQDIQEEAAKIKAAEDKPILDIVAYTGSDDRMYLDMASPAGSEQAFKIDLLVSGLNPEQATGETAVDAKIILKGAEMGTAEPAAPEAAIDWKLVEQGIAGGTDYTSTLLTLKINGKKDETAMSAVTALGVTSGGMNIGVNVDSSTKLDTFESQATINLNFMMPDPLLTITFAAKPTQEEPKPLASEGAATLLLKEEMSEGDEQLMSASLQKALPDLLTRLQTALPEEAPAILALLNPPQPAPGLEPAPEGGQEALPEPEVTEEAMPEPAPEATEEALPEPAPEMTEEAQPELVVPNP